MEKNSVMENEVTREHVWYLPKRYRELMKLGGDAKWFKVAGIYLNTEHGRFEVTDGYQYHLVPVVHVGAGSDPFFGPSFLIPLKEMVRFMTMNKVDAKFKLAATCREYEDGKNRYFLSISDESSFWNKMEMEPSLCEVEYPDLGGLIDGETMPEQFSLSLNMNALESMVSAMKVTGSKQVRLGMRGPVRLVELHYGGNGKENPVASGATMPVVTNE